MSTHCEFVAFLSEAPQGTSGFEPQSETIQKKFLSVKYLDFNKAVKIAHAVEKAEKVKLLFYLWTILYDMEATKSVQKSESR